MKITALMLALVVLLTYLLHERIFEAPARAPAALQQIAKLPRQVNESSGIVALPQQAGYLTHNDAGNQPYLYSLSKEGKLLKTYQLNLKNTDWEDLTTDDHGYLYIADTGNNNNDRRDLAVYKLKLSEMNKPQAIHFTYEDQHKFPPAKKERNFDSEAIFWHGGNLYLISKDRGRGQTAKIYRLPDKPGRHQAKLVGKHQLKAQVTGAAISPDGEKVALLSEEVLHLYTNYPSPETYYQGQYQKIKLSGAGQTEGITFEDAQNLIITSEGGHLYRYRL